MNYGLYLSAAGMLNNMHRQDVTANNLANVETAGFKRDLVSFVQREPEAQAAGRFDLSHQMMDRLGGGSWVGPSRADLSPGPLEETASPLDLAVAGEGFFVAQDQADGEPVQRLTRDGRLKIDPQNQLTMSASGLPLLDVNGEPVQVDPTQPVHVDERGTVSQGGAEIAQLRLLNVDDPLAVRPIGESLFRADAELIDNAPAATGQVRQGFVEGSNVDPIQQMLQMIETTRSISQHGTMLQYHDQLMDRAANVLGRVA